MESFYVPLGNEIFRSTDHTRGPWGPDSQHAGPPAALLGRAIEHVGARDGLQLARITFEILRPVPVADLTVTARVVRPGRNVEMIEATLEADARECMLARAWMIRAEEAASPDTGAPVRPSGPEEGRAVDPFPTGYSGYLQAIEGRFVKGSFGEPRPATAWLRARHPLLPDEELSPSGRVLIVADSASGVSSALDWNRWLFINTDLTVNFHRMPSGGWICLDAATTIGSHGIGLARSTVYDEQGAIGATAQSLFVTRR